MVLLMLTARQNAASERTNKRLDSLIPEPLLRRVRLQAFSAKSRSLLSCGAADSLKTIGNKAVFSVFAHGYDTVKNLVL